MISNRKNWIKTDTDTSLTTNNIEKQDFQLCIEKIKSKSKLEELILKFSFQLEENELKQLIIELPRQ